MTITISLLGTIRNLLLSFKTVTISQHIKSIYSLQLQLFDENKISKRIYCYNEEKRSSLFRVGGMVLLQGLFFFQIFCDPLASSSSFCFLALLSFLSFLYITLTSSSSCFCDSLEATITFHRPDLSQSIRSNVNDLISANPPFNFFTGMNSKNQSR